MEFHILSTVSVDKIVCEQRYEPISYEHWKIDIETWILMAMLDNGMMNFYVECKEWWVIGHLPRIYYV